MKLSLVCAAVFCQASPRGRWWYIMVREVDSFASRDGYSSTRPHYSSSPLPKYYIHATPLLLVKWHIAQISCYRETVYFVNLLTSLKTELEINSPFPVLRVSGAQTSHDTEADVPAMTLHSGIPRATFAQFCICSNNFWHNSADVQGANAATLAWGLLTWMQCCANAAVTVCVSIYLEPWCAWTKESSWK